MFKKKSPTRHKPMAHRIIKYTYRRFKVLQIFSDMFVPVLSTDSVLSLLSLLSLMSLLSGCQMYFNNDLLQL